MKIEIKNVKHNKQLSEETYCFSATLYVNGKRVGQCSNHGHGGQTFVSFNSKELRGEVNSYFDNLPKEKHEGLKFEFQPSLPCHIDELVGKFLVEKDNKKNTKTGIMYRLNTTPVHTYQIYGYKRGVDVTPQMRSELVKEIKDKYGKDIVEIIDGSQWWNK